MSGTEKPQLGGPTQFNSKSQLDQDIEGAETRLTTPTTVKLESLSRLQKITIIAILCSAQFFDIFNSSSAIIALPQIGEALHFSPGALPWVVSAYTLTFASSMVTAGRLSDIYHPKPVFCIGYVIVGVFSVLCAVSVHPIMLLVFRAVQGIGAAMTLSSAVAMIVLNFPEPGEQGRALSIFGASGAIGNAFGFVIGGALAARVGWRWIFYLTTMATIPFALLSFILLPKHSLSEAKKDRKLDIPGVAALTGGLILLVYAVSDANDAGWGSPQIIVTLIFAVVFLVVFFIIEYFVKDPVIPPSTWSNGNFLPLFFYSLSPYWFLFSCQLQLIQVFQSLFHWSPLSAAIHSLPLGITGGIGAFICGLLAPQLPRRFLLLLGQAFMVIGSVLFALADIPEKYWSHILPGMIVCTLGLAMSYVGANIAIMAGARPGQEGVVGAVMNTAFQVGATIGIAVVTAVTLGVNRDQPMGPSSQFKGYEASFWSLVTLNGLMMVITVLFVH